MKQTQTSPVLVVDDDESIRETVCLMLDEAGYRAVEAPDGAEALERLRASTHPYVVLLDYTMPRLDGPAFLRLLAHEPELARRHRYALISARQELDDPNLRELCARLDVPIVPKPFDLDALLDVVARLAARVTPGEADKR